MAPPTTIILEILRTAHLSVVDVIESIYESHNVEPASTYLPPHQVPRLLSLLYSKDTKRVRDWLLACAEDIYVGEVRSISRPGFGLRLNATHLKAQKLEDFSIQTLASQFAEEVPALWTLVTSLLAADPTTKHGLAPHQNREQRKAQFSLPAASNNRPIGGTPMGDQAADEGGDESEGEGESDGDGFDDEDPDLLAALHMFHGLPPPDDAEADGAGENRRQNRPSDTAYGTAGEPNINEKIHHVRPSAATLIPVVSMSDPCCVSPSLTVL